jgi:hypothetical protein
MPFKCPRHRPAAQRDNPIDRPRERRRRQGRRPGHRGHRSRRRPRPRTRLENLPVGHHRLWHQLSDGHDRRSRHDHPHLAHHSLRPLADIGAVGVLGDHAGSDQCRDRRAHAESTPSSRRCWRWRDRRSKAPGPRRPATAGRQSASQHQKATCDILAYPTPVPRCTSELERMPGLVHWPDAPNPHTVCRLAQEGSRPSSTLNREPQAHGSPLPYEEFARA